MLRNLLRATALGIAGLIIGCSVVWFGVSTWESISTRLIGIAMIFPLMGLLGGLLLASPEAETQRKTLRSFLFVVAILLGTLGNYLAFIIVSRTWSSDRLPAAHQSFAYQVTHPGVLPTLVRKSSFGKSEESWMEYVLVGVVGSAFMFWIFTLEPSKRT
jgi:hypothetical protein